MTGRAPEPPGLETVLGKTLAILQSFTVERTTLAFSELQVSTALPKATLHRVLGDLQAAELLRGQAQSREQSGECPPGPRIGHAI